MKRTKTMLLLMPLTLFVVMAANVDAKDKIRMKLTGCLQPGTTPNTFVLANISDGYTIRNTTGKAPLALARTDEFIVLTDKDTDKLQKHVGERVKVSGWLTDDSDEYPAATITGTTASSTVVSEFRVRDIDRVSGACP